MESLVPIGSCFVVIDSGRILEVIGVDDDGARTMKQLPRDTKYDPDAVFYCFESMLRPING